MAAARCCFIRDDLVDRLGWLTQSHLVDAPAMGQVMPAPLSTTATFVGYLTGGVSGALLATLVMLLRGFILVVTTPPWLRLGRAVVGMGTVLLGGIELALARPGQPLCWKKVSCPFKSAPR